MTFIMDAIGDEDLAIRVIEVVTLLTKSKNIPYDSYMSSIVSDEDALIVKLADMLHNLSDNPSPKQIGKYGKAISNISGVFQGPPPGIHATHWKALNQAAHLDS